MLIQKYLLDQLIDLVFLEEYFEIYEDSEYTH